MMPNYEFRCKECGCRFVENLPIDERDTAEIYCVECTSANTKRLISAVTHSFAEGERGESSKPDRYWSNAEENKQNRIRKEQEKVTEQSFYNDKDCPAKYKNVADELK